MPGTLMLNGLAVDVQRKAIKNIHLAVYPPAGSVRISAPLWMSDERIRLFALAKLEWIRKQRRVIQAQARETPREFLNQETHFVWGHPYLLRLEERLTTPGVNLEHSTLTLYVRPGSDAGKMQETLEGWYRQILRKAALPRLAQWQKALGLPSVTLRIRRMKTRWGTCTPARYSILLNTELAKKPRECLEYIVVHELMHFLEPNHGQNFTALMDKHLPRWRALKKKLNRLPVAHEEWEDEALLGGNRQ